MRVEYKKSFQKALKKYNLAEKEEIFKTVQTIIDSIEKFQIPKGLGLKLLIAKSRIWEARVTLNIRVLFRYEDDLLEFAYIGSHDETKRYLKTL